MVLEIADGTLSVSRIKKIVRAIWGIDITTEEVGDICTGEGIPTPKKATPINTIERQYPDKYSVFLEARTWWGQARRIWGDPWCEELLRTMEIASDPTFRSIFGQLGDVAHPQILDRKALETESVQMNPLHLEWLYPLEVIRDMWIRGYHHQMKEFPDPVSATEYPLATPEWRKMKQEQRDKACLEIVNRELPKWEDAVNYFGRFWKTVRLTRGEHYFNNLKNDLLFDGLRRQTFYGCTEDNFRHFLRNMKGFETTAPWRIPINPNTHDLPLPELLDGLIIRHGWKEVKTFVALGILMPLGG